MRTFLLLSLLTVLPAVARAQRTIANAAIRLLLFLFSFSLAAQSNSIPLDKRLDANPGLEANGFPHQVVTLEVMQRQMRENPEFATSQQENEQFTQHFSKNPDALAASYIPVVFHILYSNDVERVGYQQVMEQIVALNRDFGEVVAPSKELAPELETYKRLAAAPNIHFCLPLYDEKGQPTLGINYYPAAGADWGSDDAIKDPRRKGVAAWDSKKYLNIWVARLDGATGGYAQMPGGLAQTDGIVIDYRVLCNSSKSSSYAQGKFLTHLVGNFLNLYSLWGESYCGDDKVSDTPIHNAPNYGSPPSRHVSLCNIQMAEMITNFMDCTDDSTRFMFTKGQSVRMLATLAEGGSRNTLLKTPTQCFDDLSSDDRASSNALQSEKYTIEVLPNPATDRFYVITHDIPNAVNLTVFSTNGKVVFREPNLSGQRVLECGDWSPGIYRMVFTHEGESVATKNLIIVNH